MPRLADFDLAAAHTYFAAKCFNDAWDLMEKPDRTPADDRLMAALNQASIFHWLNREDCTDQRLAVGYWQASRIQALLGNAAEALRFGEICMSYSTGLAPFHLGFAHEALARAHLLAGDRAVAAEHFSRAVAFAAQVTKPVDRDLLEGDLRGLGL